MVVTRLLTLDRPRIPGRDRIDEDDVGGVEQAVGVGDEREFLVTGDAVNVAARLQQGAAPGEVVVGRPSTGPPSNGLTLARRILRDAALTVFDPVGASSERWGPALLEPTAIYVKPVLRALKEGRVHGMAHITGGGLAANLARVIPDGLHATVDRSTWTPDPIFDLVGEKGQVERLELEKTLNMGVGMMAIVPQESVEVALATLADRGVDSWVAGEIVDEVCDHVPEHVAARRADQQRPLADSCGGLRADPDDTGAFFLDPAPVPGCLEFRQRSPLLAVPADVLALVQADRAILAGSRVLHPAGPADRQVIAHGPTYTRSIWQCSGRGAYHGEPC